MRTGTEWRRARVATASIAADGVRLLTLSVPGPLPAFEPGSHINFAVIIDGRRVIRTYSRIPTSDGHLSVAVKRHPHSRGGSRFMWGLKPGDSIELTLPENRFELSWRAPHYLLIAGGIGVTPIFGMAKALARHAAPLRMAYAAQSRAAMAFLPELSELLGTRLEVFPLDQGRMLDLDTEIAALPLDGELYVCGPLGLLGAVKQAWAAAGRPVSRLRYEVFGDNGKFAEAPFQVAEANHGIAVDVRADQTLLDALITAGIPMIHDCERGECGLCAVRILTLDGEIDHRDVFLSEEEKAANERMCSCVSRLTRGRAVIDVGFRP
jgi:vanillate O-demethylase ferredoxin subunit